MPCLYTYPDTFLVAKFSRDLVDSLACSGDCNAKSPVEFHRLLSPPTPPATVVGRGDGDGAGDTELLLGESECSDPLDW